MSVERSHKQSVHPTIPLQPIREESPHGIEEPDPRPDESPLSHLPTRASTTDYAANPGARTTFATALLHPAQTALDVTVRTIARDGAIDELPATDEASLKAAVKSRSRTSGNSALHYASQRPNTDMLAHLLGYAGDDCNQVNNRGETPLHAAAQAGNLAAIDILLQHGANPLAMDDQGLTPLDHAVAEGHLPTSLKAAESGDGLALKLHQQLGGDLNARDEVQARTPLMLASDGGFRELVELLLSDPRVDRDAVDVHGQTAAHHAAVCGLGGPEKEKLMRTLIDAQLRFDAQDERGLTPTQLMRTNGDYALADKLEPLLSRRFPGYKPGTPDAPPPRRTGGFRR
jgi:ankyrin repeat protein